MATTSTATSSRAKPQIKSRARVRELGEVFTGDTQVQAMLDLVAPVASDPTSRFLEPTCGNGNFLVAILDRKMRTADEHFRKVRKTKSETKEDFEGRRQDEYEFLVFAAVSSIYGIDISQENVDQARERMRVHVIENYEKSPRNALRPHAGFLEAIEHVLETNIVVGDALNGGDEIFFTEYSFPGSDFDNLAGGKRRVPDILEYFSHLSANEIPASPELANNVLDLLPGEVWSNPELKWLDPAATSGVFMREAARRLMTGLSEVLPGVTERREHIFIHSEEVFGNMKFDVIIGNPPYQFDTGGGSGSQATPIYNLFVDQARKMNPRYLSMIIPARWFAGGMGLDSFRSSMLKDPHIKHLVDYPRADECFPGVEIKSGVCYFLWDRDSDKGPCLVDTIISGEKTSSTHRQLDKYDVFVRHSAAASILEKVKGKREPTLEKQVSVVNPFGLPFTYKKFKKTKFQGSIQVYARSAVGWMQPKDLTTNTHWVPKWKVLVSKAYNGGDALPHQIVGLPILAGPDSCCTVTYLVTGVFDTKVEAENFSLYLKTRLVRFLISQRKISQNMSRNSFAFVPKLDMSKTWTDAALYKRYAITPDEIAFIESQVKEMV